MQELTFNWTDYCVFSSLLGCSLLIGIYFGFFSKQDSTKEYLFGGKRMGYIPVAVSLLSSCLSGITFMGAPTEVYLNGMAYSTAVISAVLVAVTTTKVFLPTFFNLQLSCVNEYLELRFSKEARKLASIIYVIGVVVYVSVVIYVPALAFSQVTKYSIHTITPAIAIICITYTSMGGVKAVIWTDTFQFIFTIIGTTTILVVGLMDAGGISNVYSIAAAGNRTQIFESIWSMAMGWVFVTIVCTIIGLSMYAKYDGCDPLKAKYVNRADQTIVYFVIDVAGHIPGIPGIFLASLVSSSLSTMSASLNCLAGVLYDDFIVQWLPESKNKEKRAANIMKANVIIVGLLSIVLVLAMERLGTIFEIVTTIGSLLNAPNLTLFTLGMLVPCVGKKGAIAGGYSALIFLFFLVAEKLYSSINKKQLYSTLPTSIEKCDFMANASMTTTTTTMTPVPAVEELPFFLFRISMFYYTLMGTLVGIIVALLTSYLTNEMDAANVNPDYLSPVIHRFLPKKKYTEVPIKDVHCNCHVNKEEKQTFEP